jgi:RNA polymerase sigma-70 factor (ECF subfamily)
MAPLAMTTAKERETPDQDALYAEVAARYGAALDRLTRGYEADAEKRRDLLQEIHVALWRSLAGFDGRCSLRTWMYRVAHNVGASHVVRARRMKNVALASLAEVEDLPAPAQATLEDRDSLGRLARLIQGLAPVDRQVILLYLDGLDAAAIGEVTGLSAGNVATKVHRIKNVLARHFHSSQGGEHRER